MSEGRVNEALSFFCADNEIYYVLQYVQFLKNMVYLFFGTRYYSASRWHGTNYES